MQLSVTTLPWPGFDPPGGLDVLADLRVGDYVVLDQVVVRRLTPDPGEDDPLAVRVDHVPSDQGMVAVRIYVDAEVGVVIDPVAADDGAGGVVDVDAVV
jgi:hypothetical protein